MRAVSKTIAEPSEPRGRRAEREMADDLLDAIGLIDDRLIDEAAAFRPKRRRRRRAVALAAAAAACVAAIACAIGLSQAGDASVQLWAEGFDASDYFPAEQQGSQAASSGLIAADALPYRSLEQFADVRDQLEDEGTIPDLEAYEEFLFTVYYYDNGSVFGVELDWESREDLASYGDLSVMATVEKFSEPDDSVAIDVDADGNPVFVSSNAKVTDRDGVLIEGEGGEGQSKLLRFCRNDIWYTIEGSWNDDCASVAALLDWVWDHPIEPDRYPLEGWVPLEG